MKIGIIFGGPSREREISFAGGRTVFDNLDKSLFEAVPVFADSLGNFILLDWHYIYKGTIRDFYPPVEVVPPTEHGLQMYLESLGQLSEQELEEIAAKVGLRIFPHQFRQLFDFAFLTLHGPYGEDGSIQGLLEWYGIPYSGSGILPSAIGIDKIAQKALLQQHGFATPDYRILSSQEWHRSQDRAALLDGLVADLGLPLVLKAPHQGSSIGVSIIKEKDLQLFEEAVARSLFSITLQRDEWSSKSPAQQLNFVKTLTDIREGIGLPVQTQTGELVYAPEELLTLLSASFGENGPETLTLTSVESETQVLIEAFINGREFSCIVVQDQQGQPIALPPTEIRKGGEVFD